MKISKKAFKIIFIILALIILVSIIAFAIIKDNENSSKEEFSNQKIEMTLEIEKDEYDQLKIVPTITGYTGEKSLDKLHYTYYLKCTDDIDFYIARQELGATYYADVPETGTGTYSVKVEVRENVSGEVLVSAVQEKVYFETTACFVAGTQILAENGMKNIEDIQIGDKVYSINLDTNQRELKEVISLYRGRAISLYKIKIGDEIIETTPRHEFYIQDKGWTKAYELEIGDTIVSKDDSSLVIIDIEHEMLDEPRLIYNIVVDAYRNYLITPYELLVHNSASPL